MVIIKIMMILIVVMITTPSTVMMMLIKTTTMTMKRMIKMTTEVHSRTDVNLGGILAALGTE